MGILRSIGGTVRAEVTSADLPGMFAAAAAAGITLFDVGQSGGLTAVLTVSRGDYRILSKLCARRGERLHPVQRKGAYWRARGLLARPLLCIGAALMLALACFLPTRVLFVQVEGNLLVPERRILEAAEACGIGFGASRRDVRSERIKNALLEAIPELQWAGVNTRGCVATISVRERSEAESAVRSGGVSSIVAVRDGVVREITALRGSAVCKVGQAVKAGETLISGYTDCGIALRATRAEGEVFAETRHVLTAVTEEECLLRGEKTGSGKKYAIRIGKKRINFYKDSGILDVTCDKMSTEYVFTLPGGFALPVSLIVERWDSYASEKTTTQTDPSECLTEFAKRYLQQQMLAGEILERTESVSGARLYGEYACLEMIGREQSEEIQQSNGKTD